MIEELSPGTVETIKKDIILITSHAEMITKNLYNLVFQKYPEIQNLFNDAPLNQSSLLSEAISAYAMNIDRLIILTPALKVIAHSHVIKSIKPVHYSIITVAFAEALEITLGEKASLKFIGAWREAFIYLSEVLINMQSNTSIQSGE